jgi:hypothetical protein
MPCLNVDASRYSCKRHCNATLTGQQLWVGGGIDAGYQFVAQLDPVTRVATGTYLNITATGFSTIPSGASPLMWWACPPVNGIGILFDLSFSSHIRVARINFTAPMTLLNFFTVTSGSSYKFPGCDPTNELIFFASSSGTFQTYNATTGLVKSNKIVSTTAWTGLAKTPFRPDIWLINSGGSVAVYNQTSGAILRTFVTLFNGASFWGVVFGPEIMNGVAWDNDGRYFYIPFQYSNAAYVGILKVDADNGYSIVARLNTTLNATLHAVPFYGVIDPYNIYGYWAAGFNPMTWLLKVDLRTMTIVNNVTSPYFNNSMTLELDPIQSVVIPNFGGSVFDTTALQDIGTLDALGMNVQRTAFLRIPVAHTDRVGTMAPVGVTHVRVRLGFPVHSVNGLPAIASHHQCVKTMAHVHRRRS